MSPLLLFLGCVMLSPEDRLAHTDGDGDGSPASADCDDADPSRFPGAPERCDGVDQDCDGLIDEGLLPDEDGDGYGDDSRAGEACYADWVAQGGDCDDAQPTVFPGHPERCDGLNNGCRQGWSPTDELGMVTWTDPDGVQADLSASFAAGSSGDPALPELPTAGTLRICRAETDWYLRLVSSQVEALVIEGIPISQGGDSDEFDALPVLNGNTSGGQTGPTLDLSGEAWTLELVNLAITGGTTSSTRSGAGIRLANAERINLSGLWIGGNVALGEVGGGGGLALESAQEVRIEDSCFVANAGQDDTQGGGLLVVDSIVEIEGCLFQDNLVRFHGGALHAVRSQVLIRDSTFSGSVADDGGGSISVDTGSSVQLIDSSVSSSSGAQGGAVWVEGDFSASGTSFSDAYSDYRGAVMAIFGEGRAELQDCEVSGSAVGMYDHWVQEAQEGPDLYLAEDSIGSTHGHYYAVTGGTLSCSLELGCTGEVEEALAASE